ncbi:hypothetical protein [Vaccinium witches'-broom phytoplasma]|uniref:hypothetical protein n=1 Tax=Vaccinium witches'-broom phytoplasma TaxID=85642 RepID=UPI00035D767E|nr:hypothetical protein [Vaccinium witches'-broom phytoplasma]
MLKIKTIFINLLVGILFWTPILIFYQNQMIKSFIPVNKNISIEPIVLDFDPQKMINSHKLPKSKIWKNYLKGFSAVETADQYVKNFVLVNKESNIKYNTLEKKLIIKNIDDLIDKKIYFARTYIKFNPGFYKFRDSFSVGIHFYLHLTKSAQNCYLIMLEPITDTLL